MNRAVFFLSCFGVFAALVAANVLLFRGRIQNGLAARTFYTAKDTFSVEEVSFDGRDATVVATTSNKQETAALQAAAENVWGVRVANVIAKRAGKGAAWKFERKGTALVQTGAVRTEAELHQFQNAAVTAFPGAAPQGSLTVDAKLAKRPYESAMPGYLKLLGDSSGDASLELRDDLLAIELIVDDEPRRDAIEAGLRASIPKGLRVLLRLTAPERQAAAIASTEDTLRKALEAKTVFFGFDSSKVLPQSDLEVASVAELLRQNPNRRVRVLGYTDALGTAPYNHGLGGRRASGIVQALVKAGVDPKQLVTEPRGKTDFVAENKTPDGQRRNRRVQFALVSEEAG